MEISAEKVKELREKSGAGILECKKALSANEGDLEKSLEYLRKEGVVKAAKKSGRATLEGLIATSASSDRKAAVLVEVNCETDFVARTDQFLNFIQSVAEKALEKRVNAVDGLLSLPLGTGTVQEALTQLIARIGENMGIRRVRTIESSANGSVAVYLHAGAKIGAIVKVEGEAVEEGVVKDLAMHVAAMAPQYVSRDAIPLAVVEREREILRATPDIQEKPENLRDRILEGKLNRYFSEVCFSEQPFIKDSTGKKTVAQYLKDKAPKAQVTEIARFQVGEENL